MEDTQISLVENLSIHGGNMLIRKKDLKEMIKNFIFEDMTKDDILLINQYNDGKSKGMKNDIYLKLKSKTRSIAIDDDGNVYDRKISSGEKYLPVNDNNTLNDYLNNILDKYKDQSIVKKANEKLISKSLNTKNKTNKIKSKKQKQMSDRTFQMEVLWKILADQGKSKDWNDLLSLDGGTVGIAHFAAGGLGELYNAMGDNVIKKHFGQFKSEIDSVDALKNATKVSKQKSDGYCRLGSKKAIKGTCWSSMTWWKKGFKSFLASEESKDIQFKAWLEVTAYPADNLVNEFKSNHSSWDSQRGRAIAYCLVNSGGPGFLKKHSDNGKKSPNDTMESYNVEHGSVRTRYRVLNKLYPDPEFKPKHFASSYS